MRFWQFRSSAKYLKTGRDLYWHLKCLNRARNKTIFGSGNNGCSASKTRSVKTLQPLTSIPTQQHIPPDQFPEHQISKRDAGTSPAFSFLGVQKFGIAQAFCGWVFGNQRS
jgi:hypothetical protein